MALKEVHYEGNLYPISYEIIHPTQTHDLLFLHGWGSHKEIMKKAFAPHLDTYRHIYVDMPGFGHSSNEQILNTQKYAGIIQAFLQSLNIDLQTLCVIGHSFGGKVAALLPIHQMILLSSAGILEPKTIDTQIKIILAKILHTLGFNSFTHLFRSADVKHMPSCMYETFKQVLNEDFTEVFKNIQANTLILWGEYDTATSIQSGQTIASLIPKNSFYSFKGDHYFFLQYTQEVSSHIQQYLSTKEA